MLDERLNWQAKNCCPAVSEMTGIFRPVGFWRGSLGSEGVQCQLPNSLSTQMENYLALRPVQTPTSKYSIIAGRGGCFSIFMAGPFNSWSSLTLARGTSIDFCITAESQRTASLTVIFLNQSKDALYLLHTLFFFPPFFFLKRGWYFCFYPQLCFSQFWKSHLRGSDLEPVADLCKARGIKLIQSSSGSSPSTTAECRSQAEFNLL